MTPSSRLKTALLAAASLTAATVAVAHAAEAAPHEPIAIEHAAAGDHDGERPTLPATVRKIGFAAAATAVLAGLFRAVGLGRVKAAAAAAARTLGAAASAGAAVTAAASKAVVRAVSSPLRFVALFAGLTAIGFAGIGYYDLEWAGGLAVGALLASLVILGAGRVRKRLAPAPRLTSR